MRILHLIYDHIHNLWVGGGGAVRVYEIYRRLALRHKVTVICGKYPAADDYEEDNLSFRFGGAGVNSYILSTFFYALKAALFIKRNRSDFDIIIEDFIAYNPVFSFLWRKDAVIQLQQKEGFNIIKKYLFLGIPFALLESWYPRFFNTAIFVSEISRKKFGVNRNTIVISNGIDPGLLYQGGGKEEYILFLGRIHIDSKGLDILFKAYRSLKYSVKLVIAGSGKDLRRVKAFFKDYIDSGIVKLAGFVTGRIKEEVLRNCKFVVIPSRYEVQSIVVLEAAACAKAVIVSDIPELKYAVDAGFGVSFKTGDDRDLAEKIKFLLENEGLCQEMGLEGREFAKDYTWDRVSLQYEDFLLKLHRNER